MRKTDRIPVDEGLCLDIETLYKLTEVEDKVKKATEEYEQELHLKRLKEIKKRLQQAQKDNWRYPPIDSLLGFNNRR